MADPSPEDLLRLGRAAFDPPTAASSPASDAPTVHAGAADASSDAATVAAGAPRVVTGVVPRTFGRYQLLVELGRGGMGVVWKAWDSQLQRSVALKLIRSATLADSAEIDRFLREARAAARLRHPNIVPVHDVGEIDGQHYFTCDFVEGESLEAARKRETLPPRRAIALVKTVAEALHHAHGEGIVHRDVKPANILLDREGRPFVTDFGLAKEVGTGSSGPTLSGQILGTPAFMSPEQADGRIHEIGPASDQWSLGVTLYLLLTDVLPFNGQSMSDLVHAIREEEPISPTTWNKKLHADAQTIVLKTLEKDPGRRYASLADLSADLGRYLDGEPIQARPLSVVSRLARRAWKRRTSLLVASAIVLGLGAWVVAWQAGKGKEQLVSEKTAVERRLEKVQAISRVLDRWSALYGALGEIQACAEDDALSDGEKLGKLDRLWGPVEEFIKGTPPDAASQATMLALAGWAMGMAGRDVEGLEAIRKAQSTDSEVPYGFLMEALVHLDRYVRAQPLPRAVFSEAGLVFGAAPPEPPEMAEERRAIAPLLQRAGEAAFWGREGAEAVASALEGIDRMASGDYAAVQAAVTRSLAAPELKVQQTILRLARAQARYFAGDLKGASEDVDALMEAYPRSAVLLLHRAEFLMAEAARRGAGASEAMASARSAYSRVLELKPRCGDAFYGRAQVRLDQGDLAGARDDFLEALREMPREAAGHAGLGCAHFRLGDIQKAIACFDEAIRIDDGSASTFVNRSLARREAGLLEGAIEDATRAIEIEPRCAGAYNNRATARVDSGDLKGALADLDEAIQIGQVPAATWFNRGRVKDDLGDLDGAMEDLTRAIDTDEGLAEAWFARASVRISKRDPRGALSDLSRAVAVDPSYEDAWFVRGYVRMMEKDREGAIGDFRKALDVAPPGWSERQRTEELLKQLEGEEAPEPGPVK